MKNFFEWCKERNLSLEAVHKEPVRSGKKIKGKYGDTNKYSGTVRKQYDDLDDYKGNWDTNGTVDPMEVQGKGGGTGTCKKPIADIAK